MGSPFRNMGQRQEGPMDMSFLSGPLGQLSSLGYRLPGAPGAMDGSIRMGAAPFMMEMGPGMRAGQGQGMGFARGQGMGLPPLSSGRQRQRGGIY